MSEESEGSDKGSEAPNDELKRLRDEADFYRSILFRRGILAEDGRVVADVAGPTGFVRTGVDPTSLIEMDPESINDLNSRYIQIIDSSGDVQNILRKDIEKQVAKSIEAISRLAENAATTAGSIAKKVGGNPFELEEITVGLTITAAAGVILASFGGDTNLELKFTRRKGS
jgi:hypothetical protein